MKATFVLRLALVLLPLCGCGATYTQKVDFNTLEPLRVAVLPFVEIGKDGKVMDSNTSLLIDQVSVVSQDLNEKPRTLVRKIVHAELDNTALDMLAPALVNSKLMHRGFADRDLNFDLPKIYSTGAKEYCTKIFDCDAVLYGKVTRWDRSYYGIQSSTTVGIELTLVSARDGRTIFSAVAQDSDSRGITKIPTGFSDLVIEPIRGLDNDITIKLAERTVKKMMEPLRTTNKPEYLASVPPAIYAAAHDAFGGTVSRARGITVLVVGSAKKTATFSVGRSIENLPMAERAPGHYIGQFVPLKTDHFMKEEVRVSLTDKFGRATVQKLPDLVTLN